LDESTREQGFSRFKVLIMKTILNSNLILQIFAQKAEAAEQARNMLEFLAQQKFVPKNKVGQVIGKQGKTIQVCTFSLLINLGTRKLRNLNF